MGAPAGVLITFHLMGCAFVASLAPLFIGPWENRTPADQESAERTGYLMLGLFALAVVVLLMLLVRRWWWAAAVLAIEAIVGAALVVSLLDTSVHSDEWLYVAALAIGLTGLGALVCARLELNARAGAKPSRL